MTRKQLPMTGIPEAFALSEKTVAHVTERYPTVDIQGTLERFVEACEANGSMYADWQAGFRTWVRRNVEEKWKGVAYKQGKSQDPAWVPILTEASKYGFRQPASFETPASYRTKLMEWRSTATQRTVDIGGVVRSIKA